MSFAGNAIAEESSPPYEITSGIVKREWQLIPMGIYFGRPQVKVPKRITCNLCGKSYETWTWIIKHMRDVHGRNVYLNVTLTEGD